MSAVAAARPPRERNGARASTAPAPVRVLIACDHIDFDGALHGGGRQLIELLHALERTRVEPTVCILRGASALGRDLQREGLPLRFLGDARYSPLTLLRLLRIIRARRIEVLHLTDFGACTFGRLAARIARVPAIVQVITHHSVHTHRGYPRHVELVYRALARRTAKALAISGSVRRFAIERMGFRDAQTEVLYYPLPRHSFAPAAPGEVAAVRALHGIAQGDPVVGAVTRFFPVKGVRYLIDAFAQVLAAMPRAWLVLVGQGPEEPQLRAQAAALGIAARVVFAGFQRDVARYVGTFDVSVVPSLEEGFGLVAVESMALGTPVVASRVDGLIEVISDGRSGLLVEPAQPGAIAAAVLRLLADPALRARLADGGRVEAQRFALDRYVGRLSDLYEDLARRPRAASAQPPGHADE